MALPTRVWDVWPPGLRGEWTPVGPVTWPAGLGTWRVQSTHEKTLTNSGRGTVPDTQPVLKAERGKVEEPEGAAKCHVGSWVGS